MSGNNHFPGWCCRQIAAQLSQALFTMADLHAQVSDLREENRQLKIKIENIDFKRPREEISCVTISEEAVLSASDSFEKGMQAKDCEKQILIPQMTLRESKEGVSDNPRIALCHSDSSSSSSDHKHLEADDAVLSSPCISIPEDEKKDHAQLISPQIGNFKCEKCQCSFPTSDLLTVHQAIHIGRSFHVCKICHAMFLLKADLYQHYTTHPNIKQHLCQLCGKAYTSKNNYKLHIKTHTGLGLFPCEVCGKAFHSENHLNVHRRVHTGERPYECQYCNKSFTQKSGLINHTRLHTGEKPFMCPSCPKAFTQKSNLNFHLSKHHPMSGVSSS